MNNQIELDIHTSKAERLEVARILIGNGYRVMPVIRRVKNTNKTFMVIDKPQEGKNDGQQS